MIAAVSRRPSAGFTLIEALIGLSLIGVAMLLTMSLMAQQPAIERRLDAHHEALRLMEMELELLRSAVAVPQDGAIDLTGLPQPARPAAGHLQMWADVEALPGRNLYQLQLKTTYIVDGQLFDQTLETMIFWTP